MRVDNLRFRFFAIHFSILLLLLAGCDRMVTSRNTRLIKEADWKAAQGDYLWAINLYEAALDGTPQSAEVHFKLALLYDSKLKRPKDALHHLDRYLELAPEGSHVREAKSMKQESEKRLASAGQSGSPMTQGEAVRLKNENATLQKQLAELRVKTPATPVVRGKTDVAAPGARRHTVEAGETLASIAQKLSKCLDGCAILLDIDGTLLDLARTPREVWVPPGLAATLHAQAIAHSRGRPIVTLRLFSTYGPFDNPRRLVSRVIAGALEGTPIMLSRP